MANESERMKIGKKALLEHTGKEYVPALLDSSPAAEYYAHLGTERTYGDSWSRPGLDMKTRSLITLSTLAGMGMETAFKGHVRNAEHVGVTRAEMIELLIHLHGYIGTPKAGVFSGLVRGVWQEIDAEAKAS